MGRRKSSVDFLKNRMRQLKRERIKQSLSSPFICVNCDCQTLFAHTERLEDKMVSFLFVCSTCNFMSEEIVLRCPPFAVIDAYNKVVDQHNLLKEAKKKS